MNKININIEKYCLNYNGKEYIIFLIPNEEHKEFTDFYIKEKQNGIISLTVGIEIDKLSSSVEEFINNMIDEWVEDYENEINILECGYQE